MSFVAATTEGGSKINELFEAPTVTDKSAASATQAGRITARTVEKRIVKNKSNERS